MLNIILIMELQFRLIFPQASHLFLFPVYTRKRNTYPLLQSHGIKDLMPNLLLRLDGIYCLNDNLALCNDKPSFMHKLLNGLK